MLQSAPAASGGDGARDRVIAHARDLVSAAQTHKMSRTPFNRAAVEQCAETLLAYLLSNFTGVPTEEQANRVIAEQRDYLDSNVLEDLPDSLVPLAVVRTVIYAHRVMFDPKRTAHFKVFTERYGRFLRAM